MTDESLKQFYQQTSFAWGNAECSTNHKTGLTLNAYRDKLWAEYSDEPLPDCPAPSEEEEQCARRLLKELKLYHG